jgi:signal transduction histidine kinase
VIALPEALRGGLRHAAFVTGFSASVGLALAFARGGDWDVHLIYAEAIGLSIWACMDFGRHLFHLDPQTHWPSGWRTIVLQVGAVFIGYAIGTAIGDLYCGCSSYELFRRSPRSLAGYLVLTIAISASVSYFFVSRGAAQRREREIAEAQRDAAEARLKLLESQLEPHMLFNTLANLRALIGVDPPRAQAMLDQLIAFLRATLGASRVPFHALEAEFARVADYLALMQVRMGPRLETRLELPAELASLPVPPFVLQPLVENAIKHGLEPHVGKGRIEVRAVRDGDRVRLTVRDTGTGVVPGALAQVPQSAMSPGASAAQATAADPTDGTRFGLAQVRARLAAVYGAAASLELAPADDAEGGSRAVVTLPA